MPKITFTISLINLFAFLGAYVYAFRLAGFPDSVAVTVILLAASLASLVMAPLWNYQLLFQKRGYPRSWWFEEVLESRNLMML